MEAADFSGYATKAGLKCSDGRTITAEAFKHMDGMTVPLVWQHGHNEPSNVLGHAILKARGDGMYTYGFFNETPSGKNAKALVLHEDIKALSIYANQLVEKGKTVLHGMIREVSLVLSGANPGALIDFVRVAHSDGEVETLEDEAIIYTGLELEHANRTYGTKSQSSTTELVNGEVVSTRTSTSETVNTVVDKGNMDLSYSELGHAKEDATAQDVYDSLDQQQKDLVHYMIAAALAAKKDSAQHSDGNNNDGNGDEGDLEHKDKEGTGEMTRNIFENNGGTGTATGTDNGSKHVLTHDAIKGIVASAAKNGSLKEAVEEYALQHGITSLDIMFPDAKTLADRPEFNKRRTEWVPGVLNGTRHSPFSRVKSLVADITMDSARALGYIKGNFKKEEWFSVTKRTTGPTTVYKKQKLDRDDIIDITDFDVVAWMKAEMRMMLEEELARAILIGDGRDVSDEDKIKDPVGATDGLGIRSILNDHELYATTVWVNIDDASSSYSEVVEEILRARRFYKGSGTPTFYTTEQTLVEMLLTKDTLGRRLWKNKQELAAELMVADIVPVEVMEQETDLLGIIVNLADYNIGADRGGEVSLFDDFDIDYNQYKYLIETRISGALVKIKAALVVKKTAAANVLAVPEKPAFVASTGVITIPTVTGVVYKDTTATGSTMTAGAQTALAAGATKHVVAVPASGYYFATNAEDEWDFTRDAA